MFWGGENGKLALNFEQILEEGRGGSVVESC